MIDLHVHSYVSDGSNTPSEIIRMAYDKRLKAVALTDHDTIEGIKEAEIEALKLKVNLIKGIEISVTYGEGRLLHILGLGINPSNEHFLEAYTKMKAAREDGMDKILHSLKAKHNISIDIDELRTYAIGKYLDRQAIPKYFLAKGLCDTVPGVWHNYLDPIPYGKGELMEIDETLDIIKKSGGYSFLAHFPKKIGFEGYTKNEIEENIKYLVSLGLDGIERYYPSFTPENIEYADYLINKFKLIPSGGTDFHGANRPEVSLGEAENNFFIPDSVYENIFKNGGNIYV